MEYIRFYCGGQRVKIFVNNIKLTFDLYFIVFSALLLRFLRADLKCSPLKKVV